MSSNPSPQNHRLIDINKVKELLIALDIRGFMTIFGIRTSPGSQNEPWPEKSILLDAVNKRHKKDRIRPRVVHPNNTSILTVGGRALAKHSSRSVDKFWGNCDGKTESYKNEAAFAIVQQILNECVWMNVHILHGDKIVIECRNNYRIDDTFKGYGVRWTTDGEFIGFLDGYRPSSP